MTPHQDCAGSDAGHSLATDMPSSNGHMQCLQLEDLNISPAHHFCYLPALLVRIHNIRRAQPHMLFQALVTWRGVCLAIPTACQLLPYHCIHQR